MRANDPDDNGIPEVPAKPRTKPGDIWKLGRHRVGCGDGRDVAFLEKVIGDDAQIDAAFLDPPYNVRINGHANARGRHREFAMASGEMNAAEFKAFLKQTLGACAGVSRDGAVHFVCMDWRHMDDLSCVGRAVYGDLLNLCVWNKSNAGMGSLYRSKHEMVFVFRVGSAPHLNAVELGKHGRNRTNVWDYASVNTFAGIRRDDLDALSAMALLGRRHSVQAWRLNHPTELDLSDARLRLRTPFSHQQSPSKPDQARLP